MLYAPIYRGLLEYAALARDGHVAPLSPARQALADYLARRALRCMRH